MKKPNVVFLLTDDQRYDTIAALGNSEIHTPVMDSLVQRGTAFTNAHIPCGTSGAICMPSRAMLLSGRTLFEIEGEGQNIPPEHTTLGEMFKDGGYATYGIGKWHNGTSSYNRCFDDGKEIFFGGMWDHWNVPVNYYDSSGTYQGKNKYQINDSALSNHPLNSRGDKIAEGVHSSQLFADAAVEFISAYDKENPFFLYTSFLAPHDPRTMPKEYREMYDPEKITLPDNFLEQHFDFGISGLRDELLAPYPRNPNDIKRHIADYYAMITHLDAQIGRIIQSLEQKDMLNDTIIVLTSDNGLGIGSHGLMGKQSLYDHSVRVPLIFSGPGIPAGQICDNFLYLFDIFPTLCDMIGTDIPSSVLGKSFYSSFSDPKFSAYKHLYLVYCHLARGVKNKQYKLIEYRNHVSKTQLFDLASDPSEINDISSLHPNIVDAMRKEMFCLRDEWRDIDHRLGKQFWDAW